MILWGYCYICGPTLANMSLCSTWLYTFKRWKKLISKKLGNKNVLYASLGDTAFMQGKKSTFCISRVKMLVIVSKCWHITALFLVLSGQQRSKEFRTVGEDVAKEAFLMLGNYSIRSRKRTVGWSTTGTNCSSAAEFENNIFG